MAYVKNGLFQKLAYFKNGLFQKWPISKMVYFKIFAGAIIIVNVTFFFSKTTPQLLETHYILVDLTKCNYDQLLLILTIGRRLSDIGFEFCKSESVPLQNILKEAALSFFQTFHQNKIDDLKMFLLNEAWEPCPVRADFDYSQLKEFKEWEYCIHPLCLFCILFFVPFLAVCLAVFNLKKKENTNKY